MSEFEREDRYLVIKRKDLAKVPGSVQSGFLGALNMANHWLPKREYVVVESDWPEYEVVFKLLEARVTGKTCVQEPINQRLLKALKDFVVYADEVNDDSPELDRARTVIAQAEVELQPAEITSTSRLKALEELCGYWQDGSQTTVTIYQDDATRTFILSVGDKRYYGSSLKSVLDAVVKGDEL